MVCGINHKQIQQNQSSLISQQNQSSLISQHQANSVNREDPPNVFKIFESKSEKSCYRCDGNHRPETSAFKDKEFYYCKAKGHTIKVCRKKQKQTKSDAHSTHQVSNATPFKSKSNVKFDEKDDIFEIFQLNQIQTLQLKLK